MGHALDEQPCVVRRGADHRASDRALAELPSELLPDLDFADNETIRYQRPELPSLTDVARYYALSEEARFYSNGGPCHQRLSSRLAAFVGDVSCVPVGNCTLGLMAALREVCGPPRAQRKLIAVPSFTFTATACAIHWAGYEPLFVDVEPESWQLSPDALRGALERRPGSIAGVMGCSTFGTAPPAAVRAGWRRACADHDVPLLIDSAAGFGALDDDRIPLGGQGDVEVFSFHATKPFAIGEGGAVITSDAELAARISRIINFGIDPDLRASTGIGLNAKMSELHAATGLAMLDRFDQCLQRRRETAARLQAVFSAHPLTYQTGAKGSTWQVFQVLMPDPRRRQLALTLAQAHHIEVRTSFDPPLHRHPAFAGALVAGDLEVTEALAARALSLPMANSMGPRQTTRLAALMDAVFEV
jgi:dTDP-4-amino-4,6-dideoxygalactose transaminase